jgi:hypothetical protein
MARMPGAMHRCPGNGCRGRLKRKTTCRDARTPLTRSLPRGGRRRRPAPYAAAIYAAVGISFAWPAAHIRVWRLAAWVVSAVVYAAHIAYERFTVRSATAQAAMHVALGVALGAFGLAVGANIHSLSVGSSARQHTLLLAALVTWPLITSVPSFVIALSVSAVLRRR